MFSIFYDLETSDLQRVGQILNFAFVLVDSQFQTQEICASEVRLSPLQLPRAGAILANRVDVIAHQANAKLSEFDAAEMIGDFLVKVSRANGGAPVPLIGYNSAKFDLPYLRTVLIRNGIPPYPRGIVNRDLFQLCRALACKSEQFLTEALGEEKSFRLEAITRRLGLLTGEQLHESFEDVQLTVRLAETLLERYGVDIRSFEPYRVQDLHQRGLVSMLRIPWKHEDGSPGYGMEFPALFLCSDKSGALWVDLDRYKTLLGESADEGALRSAVQWYKLAEHVVLPGDGRDLTSDERALGADAFERFRTVTLQNYFAERSCDIEQHIYRLPFSDFDRLFSAIRHGGSADGLSKDARHLLRRSQLERGSENPAGSLTDDLKQGLRDYAKYRYGGRLRLNDKGETHPTLKDLYNEIEVLQGQGGDPKLLNSLRQFYDNSEIVQLAGAELLS